VEQPGARRVHPIQRRGIAIAAAGVVRQLQREPSTAAATLLFIPLCQLRSNDLVKRLAFRRAVSSRFLGRLVIAGKYRPARTKGACQATLVRERESRHSREYGSASVSVRT
jgi:hypothetical protein